ncbi:hypothetical protein CEK63_15165 [Xanthomonas sontii]|nr:hypothetical protein CEK63_15165 [Xanthomonas sontii]
MGAAATPGRAAGAIRRSAGRGSGARRRRAGRAIAAARGAVGAERRSARSGGAASATHGSGSAVSTDRRNDPPRAERSHAPDRRGPGPGVGRPAQSALAVVALAGLARRRAVCADRAAAQCALPCRALVPDPAQQRSVARLPWCGRSASAGRRRGGWHVQCDPPVRARCGRGRGRWTRLGHGRRLSPGGQRVSLLLAGGFRAWAPTERIRATPGCDLRSAASAPWRVARRYGAGRAGGGRVSAAGVAGCPQSRCADLAVAARAASPPLCLCGGGFGGNGRGGTRRPDRPLVGAGAAGASRTVALAGTVALRLGCVAARAVADCRVAGSACGRSCGLAGARSPAGRGDMAFAAVHVVAAIAVAPPRGAEPESAAGDRAGARCRWHAAAGRRGRIRPVAMAADATVSVARTAAADHAADLSGACAHRRARRADPGHPDRLRAGNGAAARRYVGGVDIDDRARAGTAGCGRGARHRLPLGRTRLHRRPGQLCAEPRPAPTPRRMADHATDARTASTEHDRSGRRRARHAASPQRQPRHLPHRHSLCGIAMISLSRKIALLGNFAVGKTSLVARAVRNTFSEHYLTTVGVKVDSKAVALSPSQELRMVLWDIAGASLIDQLRGHYLIGSHGLLLVADGTRAHTLDTVLELREQAERIVGRSLPAVLVLNKCDMADQWDVTPAHVRKLAEQLPTFSASARVGHGVEEAFAALAAQLERSP